MFDELFREIDNIAWEIYVAAIVLSSLLIGYRLFKAGILHIWGDKEGELSKAFWQVGFGAGTILLSYVISRGLYNYLSTTEVFTRW